MSLRNPLAIWLDAFFTSDAVPRGGRGPAALPPLFTVNDWRLAYPFVAIKDNHELIDTLKRLKVEDNFSNLTAWILDPEVRLVLATAALKYLAENIPLIPGDLALPVAAARQLGVGAPGEIGSVAPRVAYIIYAMSAPGSPLRQFRRTASPMPQLAHIAQQRISSAPPTDLLAIHAMIKHLLTLPRTGWVAEALKLCLPLSPLTRLLEDSDDLNLIASYEWAGIETVLCSFGLDGLQTRCSQSFVEMMMPGFDWHKAERTVREARFRRASQMFSRLAQMLQKPIYVPASDGESVPEFGTVRSMRLAIWILSTYRMMGRALETFQRVVTPPAFDPRKPMLTPSFRMLRTLLPASTEGVREYYAGLTAPVPPVIALLREAGRLTNTTLYIPDGFSDTVLSEQLEDTDEHRLLAAQMVEVWKTMDTRYAPTIANLYQFVEASQGPEFTGLFAPDVLPYPLKFTG